MNFPATNSPAFLKIPANPQKALAFIVAFLIISPNSVLSQSSFSSAHDDNYSNKSSDSVSRFEPSLAVVLGALSIAFSLTFLTIIYAKCCHMSSSSRREESFGNLSRTRSRFSGIDKFVIESLPFFKFSSLKGWKNGLECSVCLSGFEEVEILRLLPKCKHAFHIGCIDQWLEKHSSCPLCRFKVTKDDIAIFTSSNSLRFNESQHSSLGLFIEREGSSRFGTNIEKDQDQETLHKFNHRIVVCDHDPMMLKTRWSNVSSSDLLFLKSEMITCISSNHFDHQSGPEIEGNFGGDARIEEARRSVSEIIVHPRFLEDEVRVDDQRIRKIWLPIARKTVERFANKQSSSILDGHQLQIEKSKELLDV